MKYDPQPSSQLLSSSLSASDVDVGELNQSKANVAIEIAPPVHYAFRASLMYLIAAILALCGELYLAFQSGAWQMFTVAGIGAMLAGLAAGSVYLVRRGQPYTGIRLLIWASLSALLLTPLLVAGFGLMLGLGTILVVLTIALQALPQKEANRILMVSVGAAIVAGGLDVISPPSQLNLPAFGALILALGGSILLIYAVLTARQFRLYPLTTKLILAFLVISLFPLGLLAFVNYRNTRTVLTEKAQQALFAAVSKTAEDIDTFISDNLETIQTEAQLPVLAAYLNLAAEQRPGSVEEAAVLATLQELSRKNKVFIDSYALLDSQGRNIMDSLPPNVGRDESARDYFQKPLETNLPYVSPVEFVSPEEADSPRLKDQAVLHFSSPIHDPITSQIIGVLRSRYKSMILQQLVVQNNSLIGEQSYAILFDENHICLAHGAAPELIFQPVVPLDARQLARLQETRRLPPGIDIPRPTGLPDLAAGLNNAIFEPYFTTRLASSGNRINLAVVKELDTQPWSVVFAQPQDLFLSPIQAQTRTTLFLAIVIAGIVAAAAFVIGQLLANPLVDLTGTVTQFTAGNLEARAQLKSSDESGILAASFNTMAEQVGKLLRNLAERTHELEAEIYERKRAERELQASEQKFRRIFEDSTDVIFVTTPTGEIIDINPRGLSLFGYDKIELKQLNIQTLYKNPDDHLQFLQEMGRHGSVKDLEVKFLRSDGQARNCLVTATARPAENGIPPSYQGIIRDITEQKQAEKERLRLLAIEQELTLAQQIQQSMLPPSQPEWRGPDVVCYSTPAREMGGDLYAYHAFDDCRFAVAVGDVSGKGMPAALLMAVSLASLQTIVSQGLRPSMLLTHLDQVIAPYTRETNQNCALIYVDIILSPPEKGGLLHVANAGCISPMIRRANGTTEWIDAFGIPLGTGLQSHFGYQEFEVPLAAGDLVILTSDGVVEANNAADEMFGFGRLEQAVATGPLTSASALLDHLKTEVAAFARGAEPHDDITIVIIQV
jgi:PAS domain S-box-containing protein